MLISLHLPKDGRLRGPFSDYFDADPKAPDMTYGHMYKGVLPFIAIQLLLFLIILAVPDIATWLPRQLF